MQIFTYLLYMPRSGKAKSYVHCLTTLESYRTIFQSGCTILPYHQQCVRVSITSWSYQHLLLSFLLLQPSSWIWSGISMLLFPNKCCCWASFEHVPTGHLHSFLRKYLFKSCFSTGLPLWRGQKKFNFLNWIKRVLYILDRVPYQKYNLWIFSLILYTIFSLLIISHFPGQNFLILI